MQMLRWLWVAARCCLRLSSKILVENIRTAYALDAADGVIDGKFKGVDIEASGTRTKVVEGGLVAIPGGCMHSVRSVGFSISLFVQRIYDDDRKMHLLFPSMKMQYEL